MLPQGCATGILVCSANHRKLPQITSEGKNGPLAGWTQTLAGLIRKRGDGLLVRAWFGPVHEPPRGFQRWAHKHCMEVRLPYISGNSITIFILYDLVITGD